MVVLGGLQWRQRRVVEDVDEIGAQCRVVGQRRDVLKWPVTRNAQAPRERASLRGITGPTSVDSARIIADEN